MAETPDSKAPHATSKEVRRPQLISGQIDVAPQNAPPLLQILKKAESALKNRNFKDVRAEIARAEAVGKDDPRVLHLKGLYEFEQQNAVQAYNFLSKALELRPNDASIQHNIAAVLSSLGRFQEAEKLLLSVIARRPNFAEAYHTLSNIRTFTADDPLIARIEDGLNTKDLSTDDRSFYAFALAKAQDDAGNPEKAWHAAEIGNAIEATSYKYNPASEAKAVEEVEEFATRDRLEGLAPFGHQTRAPIFVVGMPRSGTTLLESIIAEHPQVLAAGELTALGVIGKMVSRRLKVSPIRSGFAKAIENLTPHHQFGAAMGYLNAAHSKSPEWVDYFIDKLPDNSFNLGFAAALLPKARVIHIMRHPLDVMLSIYFKRFTSMSYAFTPEHIVGHWQNYQRVMEHWRVHLPLEMIEIRYENLVQDKDFAQKILWEKLGLTAQVDHVKAAPQLEEQRTASLFQVKQPVYQTSRQKFAKYEAHMGAFIKALGGMDAIEAEVNEQEARCALRASLGAS